MFDFCQLAKPWDGLLKAGKRYIVEPKIDGLRCLLILDPKEPKALSRNGNPLKNMDSLLEACMSVLPNMVLDGECYAGSWEASMTAGRRNGADTSDRKLWIFDALPLSEFNSQKTSTPLYERKLVLDKLYCVPGTVVVDWKRIIDAHEVYEYAERMVALGFEGTMLKDFDAVYSFKRNNNWQKFKFFQDAEFKCLDMFEGEGKLIGMMGGIVVDVDGVKVGVGTGFDDATRQFYWNAKDQILNKWVTIKYQRVSPDGSLIFPVFLRVQEGDMKPQLPEELKKALEKVEKIRKERRENATRRGSETRQAQGSGTKGERELI